MTEDKKLADELQELCKDVDHLRDRLDTLQDFIQDFKQTLRFLGDQK